MLPSYIVLAFLLMQLFLSLQYSQEKEKKRQEAILAKEQVRSW